jgi:hypothetical protein
MKRLFSMLFASLLVLSLTACSAAPSSTAPATATPKATPTPSAKATPAPTSSPTVKAFNVSAEDTRKGLSEFCQKNDYANAFETSPHVEESRSETLGERISYVYSTGKGVMCIIEETKSDHKLTSVGLMGTISSMEDSDIKTFARYINMLLNIFESDKATLSKINSKLDIGNSGFKDKTVNLATGSVANFSYMVDKDMVLFDVTKK